MKQRGIVKYFNKEKGYGFIGRKELQDIYFHLAKSVGVEYKSGDVVDFNEAINDRGPIAVDVTHSDEHNY